MAGVRMRIEAVGLGALQSALASYIRRGGDLTPAMRSIGESLLTETRDRFRAGTDPSGNPWAPLSAVTTARKRRNRDKILIMRGHLLGTLAIGRVDASSVEVGSTRIYAGTMQFGAAKGAFGSGSYKTRTGSFPIPWGDIPPRPFLGLSSQSESTIARIISDHIARPARDSS